jgi:mRNA-degrading endonuclease RelE of RelBE toxin-antitoxin system
MTSQKTEQDALETSKSDISYREYVEEERERRAEKKVEEIQKSVQEDLEKIDRKTEQYRQKKMEEMKDDISVPENPDLSKLTEGRVRRVEETATDSFKVVVETHEGEKFTQVLELGLPEDKNEWERLCQYVGVPPQPSELAGQKVPILVPKDSSKPWIDIRIPPVIEKSGREWGPTLGGYSENKIDVPPISKGLNPLKYKFRRSIGQKARHSSLLSTGVEKLGRTFPWTGSLSIVVLGMFSMAIATSTNTLLTIPVGVVGYLLCLIGMYYGMWAYGRLALWIIPGILADLGKSYKMVKNRLFPSD